MFTTNRELASQLRSPATLDMERNLAEYAQDAPPVLAALSAAGHPIEDLQDVLRLQVLPKAIVPVLLEWLPRVVVSGRIDVVEVRKTDVVEIREDFRVAIAIQDQRGRRPRVDYGREMGNAVQARQLILAVPPAASSAQMAVLQNLQAYGRALHNQVEVVLVFFE